MKTTFITSLTIGIVAATFSWAGPARAAVRAEAEARLEETGVRLWGLGMFDEAANVLQAALSEAPEDVAAQCYLMDCLKRKQTDALKGHVSALEARLDHDGGDGRLQFLVGHGKLLLGEGEYDAAWAALKSAEDRGFAGPHLDLDKARLRLVGGDRGSALELLDAVSPEAQEDPLVALRRATLLKQAGREGWKRFFSSGEALQRGLDAHPECVLLRTLIGEILAQGNQLEQARREYDKALEMVPGDHEVVKSTLEFLYDAGRFHEYATLFLKHAATCDACRGGLSPGPRELGRAGMRALALAIMENQEMEKPSPSRRLTMARLRKEMAFYRARDRSAEPLVFTEGKEAEDRALSTEVSALPRLVLLVQPGSAWNDRFQTEVLQDREVREQLDRCLLLRVNVEDGPALQRVRSLAGEGLFLSLPRAVLLGPTGRELVAIERIARPDQAARELKEAIDAFSRVDVALLREGGRLRWAASVQEALGRGGSDGRGILLYFTDPDDPWCRRMDEEVLADPLVAASLSSFAAARISDRATAAAYGVARVPALLFLDPQGRKIYQASGFMKPEYVLRAVRALDTKDKPPHEPAIPWLQDLGYALETGRREHKNILVDVYTDWCHWCRVLEEKTFPDAAVIDRISSAFVPLKENPEIDKDFAARFTIAGYPSTLILSPDGTEIARFIGFAPPAEYLQGLNVGRELDLARKLGSEQYARLNTRLQHLEDAVLSLPKTTEPELAHLAREYPADPRIWGVLARARWLADDERGALEALKHTVTADGGMTREAYAELFQNLAPGGEAFAVVVEAIKEVSPKVGKTVGASALLGLADVQVARNMLDEAAETATLAATKTAGSAGAWLALARIEIMRERYDEAARALGRFRPGSNGSPEAAALEAVLLRIEGKRDEAEASLAAARVSERVPAGVAGELESLARSFERRDKRSQAAAAWWAGAALAGEDAEALNRYGFALAEAGEALDESLDVLSRAQKIAGEDDDLSAILDSLAWAHYQKGDYVAAFEALSDGLAREGGVPPSDEERFHLGVILGRLGLSRLARKELAAIASPEEPESKDRSVHARAYRELARLE